MTKLMLAFHNFSTSSKRENSGSKTRKGWSATVVLNGRYDSPPKEEGRPPPSPIHHTHTHTHTHTQRPELRP